MPEYIPRRIGEILRPVVLVGAALGGVLSLAWLRARALPGAMAGVVAVVAFAAFATRRAADQHPIRVPRRGDPVRVLPARPCAAGWSCRAATPAGAGGWRRRRVSVVALAASTPSQYRPATSH